ncbi:hypothetical protein [Bacillus cereus]|uniref:hypothetical protein n=1 Tax=Bacillus cereus TaxID=1396 RepID=UPI0015CF31C7|nr:hypothetical protein [Bacillus cereus]
MGCKIILDGKRMQFVADVVVEFVEKYGVDAFRQSKEERVKGISESINQPQ